MNIVDKPQIWDLHIHTNKCPKGSSEFAINFADKTKDYIDGIVSVINSDEHIVSLISFTDHNYISFEVYQEFNSRNCETNLIAGVEIDYLSSQSNTAKHMIVYFDIDTKNEEKFSLFCTNINSILKNTREENKFTEISKLLTSISKLNYSFMISPHAFKQGNRGLDFDFIDEDTTNQNKNFYTDQFFCFWEAGGLSEIEKAKRFLVDFEIDKKISVISFSDSNNFKKMKHYVDNPPQYFNSLPTFKGLALVGTDSHRIVRHDSLVDPSNYGNIINRIVFDGKEVVFSPRLNSIIGGRGSGKSLLLDTIASNLDSSISFSETRNDFINNFDVEVYDLNSKKLTSGFSFDYFGQAYIADIFNSPSKNTKLEDKFKDSFDLIDNINTSEISHGNSNSFINKIIIDEIQTKENIASVDVNFKKLTSNIDISIAKKNLHKIKKSESLIDYDNFKSYKESTIKKIPEPLKNNPRVINKINSFFETLVVESHEYNLNLLRSKMASNLFMNTYLKSNDERTDASKNKAELIKEIEKKFTDCSLEYRKRVEVINAIFEMQTNFKSHYINKTEVSGSIENRFIFTKELLVESPVEYLYRCFDDHINKNKFKKFGDFSESNLENIIREFVINKSDIYKEGSGCDALYQSILDFKLIYTPSSKIYYYENAKYKDINELSPGARTNILMEYIVYRDTKKPLLIDQPEDNIDNMTIYKDLKKWFSDLKFKRQVIVVTHDANIVINADSENIIIANQIEDDEFSYTFGAMEYEDNLDKASLILDGGYEAVERRMKKYDTR